MRALALVLIWVGGWVGCAYPRYTTPIHMEPNARLSSKDQPAGMYTFRLLSAEVAPTKVSGLAWDDDGSGPDPFVRLYIDGRLVWESDVMDNQTRPQWNVVLPRNVIIHGNSLFRLELWDRDSSITADPMGEIEHRGLPDNAVPDAQARLQLDSRSTVLIMVGPPHAHKGVGLSVEARSDALKVYEIEPYSPAARAGIRVGDRIVGIGSERVAHMGGNDAISELSLAAERSHKLSVTDSDGKNEHDVTLDQGYIWLAL
jgi:hypothetical protein